MSRIPLFATRLSRLARPLAAGLASAAIVRECYVHTESAPSSVRHNVKVSLPSASALETLSYRGQFRGQLSPPLPEAGATQTSCGAVVRDGESSVAPAVEAAPSTEQSAPELS